QLGFASLVFSHATTWAFIAGSNGHWKRTFVAASSLALYQVWYSGDFSSLFGGSDVWVGSWFAKIPWGWHRRRPPTGTRQNEPRVSKQQCSASSWRFSWLQAPKLVSQPVLEQSGSAATHTLKSVSLLVCRDACLDFICLGIPH